MISTNFKANLVIINYLFLFVEKSPVRGLLTPCLSRMYIYILCQVTIYVLRQYNEITKSLVVEAALKNWTLVIKKGHQLFLSSLTLDYNDTCISVTSFFFSFFFHSPLYDYFLYATAGEKAVKKFPLLPLPSLPCSHLFMYLIPHWFLKLDRCKTWDKSETIRNDFFDYWYFIVVSYFCAL